MQLDVYIAAHCSGCEEARRLARAAAARFPDLRVKLIDLEEVPATGRSNAAGHELPVDLVAVPTYFLDGRVIALGNPPAETLFARVSRQLRLRGDGGPHGEAR